MKHNACSPRLTPWELDMILHTKTNIKTNSNSSKFRGMKVAISSLDFRNHNKASYPLFPIGTLHEEAHRSMAPLWTTFLFFWLITSFIAAPACRATFVASLSRSRRALSHLLLTKSCICIQEGWPGHEKAKRGETSSERAWNGFPGVVFTVHWTVFAMCASNGC